MKTLKKQSPAVIATSEIFSSIRQIVEIFSVEEYTKPLEVLSGSSLGQHFRHIVEFYNCIAEGSKNNKLCYDDRKRDVRLETSPDFIKLKMDSIMNEIEKLDVFIPLDIEVKYSSDPNEKRTEIRSTFGRELTYGFDHSIHHLAIVKIAIQLNFPKIKIPDDLGVAPSTLQYRNQCAH